jgi:phosphorylcholine metabolism protein LicD
MDNNFTEVIQILNNKKINYWVCHGTLLGLARDGKLIEWDHDIDIALWDDEVSKSKIISLMEKMNFKLREGFGVKNDLVSFDRAGGRIVDFTFLRKKIKNQEEIAFVSYYMPKNFIMKCLDGLSNADKYSGKYKIIIRSFAIFKSFFKILKNLVIRKNLFYKEYNLYTPTSFLKKTSFLPIQELAIKAPSDYEGYLKFIYGNDWKIPKKNYVFPRNYKTF